MGKKVIVISLGGSLIVPDEVNVRFLKEFKSVLLRNYKNYKFVVVCGGGSVARKYINALRSVGIPEIYQSQAGISATRMNARFMSYFFDQDQEKGIPHNKRTLKRYVRRMDVVFCGALEYKPKQTSDSTAAEIAKMFNSIFINLTNVSGLHDKNPKKFKDAKFIPAISWKNFDIMANKSKFMPGQHFILDQTASKIIMEKKITTYILGENMKELDNLLKGKKFKGTIISG
jgi:uridylate kinase